MLIDNVGAVLSFDGVVIILFGWLLSIIILLLQTDATLSAFFMHMYVVVNGRRKK